MWDTKRIKASSSEESRKRVVRTTEKGSRNRAAQGSRKAWNSVTCSKAARFYIDGHEVQDNGGRRIFRNSAREGRKGKIIPVTTTATKRVWDHAMHQAFELSAHVLPHPLPILRAGLEGTHQPHAGEVEGRVWAVSISTVQSPRSRGAWEADKHSDPSNGTTCPAAKLREGNTALLPGHLDELAHSAVGGGKRKKSLFAPIPNQTDHPTTKPKKPPGSAHLVLVPQVNGTLNISHDCPYLAELFYASFSMGSLKMCPRLCG